MVKWRHGNEALRYGDHSGLGNQVQIKCDVYEGRVVTELQAKKVVSMLDHLVK